MSQGKQVGVRGYKFNLRLNDLCLSINSSHVGFMGKLRETFVSSEEHCLPDVNLRVEFIHLSEEESLEQVIIYTGENINSWREIKGLQDMIDGYYRWDKQDIEVIFKEMVALFPRFYLFPLLVRAYYTLRGNSGPVFLHAAGIVRGERGYIFAGGSGSGKTFVSALSVNKSLVLNDEMVLVSRSKDHYQVSGVPLKTSFFNATDVKVPVKYIFFLQPSDYTSLKKLKPGEAVLRLISVLALPQDYSLTRLENISRAVGIASALARGLSCYDMHFEKNDRFWEHIEDLNSNYQEGRG